MKAYKMTVRIIGIALKLLRINNHSMFESRNNK